MSLKKSATNPRFFSVPFLGKRSAPEVMNFYVRVLIAVFASLLVHIALVAWIMQQMKIRSVDDREFLQVTLSQSDKHSAQPLPHLMESTLPQAGKPDVRPIRAVKKVTPTPDSPKSIQAVAIDSHILDHFHWRPPSTHQQSGIMNGMQLSLLAHQRASQVTAVLAGLSAISSQLSPTITASIVCVQQTDNNIDCTPEPKENERALIIQFFSLALQARGLGISENPVRMDFGTALSVSVTLRQ